MKKPKKNTEQTSEPIASIAGRVLSGNALKNFETWLQTIALFDPTADNQDKVIALEGLKLLEDVKRLAGSALTQRG